MKFARIVRYILGAVCIGTAIYFVAWSLLNPDYAVGYPLLALAIAVAGVLIILSAIFDKDFNPDKGNVHEADVHEAHVEEETLHPDETTVANGIDVSKIPYKSKTIAILLCLFFGGLGLHRIYLGHIESGVILLFITLSLVIIVRGLMFTVGIFALGIFLIVDIFKIAVGKLKDGYNRPLV